MKTLYSALWLDSHPFDELVDAVEQVNTPDQLTNEDSILVVWGGADINPTLYNHSSSRTTYPGGKRDVLEWALMKTAVAKNIPVIGVCRGAQMLCALAGGYLLQDVRGHLSHHSINTFNGLTLEVNSIHHQMMCWDEEGMTDLPELLAWASQPQGKSYIWKNDLQWIPPEGWVEPEFVYFPNVKGFAIQWHPEMMPSHAPATQFILSQIKEKLCLMVPS